MRLDDVVSLNDTVVDFMWVDVQGAEDLVFTGAKDVLSRTRYVYTEYATDLYEGQLNRRSNLFSCSVQTGKLCMTFGGYSHQECSI
jgi:hypothetical protein